MSELPVYDIIAYPRRIKVLPHVPLEAREKLEEIVSRLEESCIEAEWSAEEIFRQLKPEARDPKSYNLLLEKECEARKIPYIRIPKIEFASMDEARKYVEEYFKFAFIDKIVPKTRKEDIAIEEVKVVIAPGELFNYRADPPENSSNTDYLYLIAGLASAGMPILLKLLNKAFKH